MKKSTLSSAALCLFILGLSAGLHAQSDAAYVSNAPHANNNTIEVGNSSSNEKAINSFKKEFSNAEKCHLVSDTRWYCFKI